MNRLGLVATVALLSAVCTHQAQAQSTSAASQQLFQDGTTLLKSGKVREACAKFDESQKLEPQLGTLLNLAACREKEGKVATAWSEYTELAAVAARKNDEKRATYAKQKIAELEPQLPRLQLDVPAETSEVKLDGAELGRAAWNVALPFDPGEHVITYSAPSKKSGTLTVTALKGQTTNAKLPALPDDAGPMILAPSAKVQPTRPPPSTSNDTPEPSHRSPLRTAGYIVGGAGIVGLGVGTVFGLVALGDKSTVNQQCTGSACSQSGLDAVDSAHRDATISTIGFVAGGVCLAAGVTMVLLGREKTSPQVGLAPFVHEGTGGLIGFGRF